MTKIITIEPYNSHEIEIDSPSHSNIICLVGAKLLIDSITFQFNGSRIFPFAIYHNATYQSEQ